MLQISVFIYLFFIHYIYYLFIYLFLVKHVYSFLLSLDTFEDAIQPLAVEMYMITCLLHAQHTFQQDNLWLSCKDWPESVETSCLDPISAVLAQYHLI